MFNPDPYVQQGGDMVRVGGFDFTCSPGEAIGHRISPHLTVTMRRFREIEIRHRVRPGGTGSDAEMLQERVSDQMRRPASRVTHTDIHTGLAEIHR